MEPRTRYGIALVALMLVVLALRLVLSFQVQLPSYESYFTLIQADAIRETGVPRTLDAFSYEGRRFIVTPLYYYVVAGFTFFVPEQIALKVLPNIFMALLVPLAYLIAHNLTKSRWASLSAAFFAGFSPLIFTSYANSALPLSLALPIAAALLLALLELESSPGRALILTGVLILLSPIAWLFVGLYLIYLVILTAERMRIAPAYFEAALFTFLLTLWYTLIAYKSALFRHGLWAVAGSLPSAVRALTFQDFSLLATIYAVGVVPLVLGCYVIYHVAFEQRSRKVYLVVAFGLATLGCTMLRLLPLRVGLLILSFAFAVLSAHGLFLLSSYLQKTRLLSYRWILGAIFLIFVFSSLLPALAAGIYPQSSPTQHELEALAWIRSETPQSSVVLATPKSGFLVNYAAERPYVADEEYLLIANPDSIIDDIDEAYTTPSTLGAVELLERYDVQYVLIGPRENARYGELGAIIKDRDCFPIAHQNPQVLVIALNCTRGVGQ